MGRLGRHQEQWRGLKLYVGLFEKHEINGHSMELSPDLTLS